jgi:hypothetical protein
MKTPLIFDRAVNLFDRYRLKMSRRRDQAKVAGLPDYLLKDIGWPASQSDCCTDRAR